VAQTLDALRDWGVPVKAYQPDGTAWWRHTTAGGWAPIGVMHHHTAGSRKVLTDATSQAAMLRLLRVGTAAASSRMAARDTADEEIASAVAEHLTAGALACHDAQDIGGGRRVGLPGPLCHLAPAMVPGTDQARVWLIGWGNTNHAGLGSARVADLIARGEYQGQAPGPDAVDGNTLLWGLEYLHPGDSTPWPDALLDVGHRAACALSEACGWSRPAWPGSQLEHREWTTRKIDRSWTGDVRAAVHAIAEGDTVALTKDDADTVWERDCVSIQDYTSGTSDATRRPVDPDNPTWAPKSVLAWLYRAGDRLTDIALEVLQLLKQHRTEQATRHGEVSQRLDALADVVESIRSGGTLPVDTAALVTAVADELDARARARLTIV